MNFAQLKALRTEIWPEGEAPELVIPHNKSFISGLIDLQKKVECLQVNNTEVYEFCATLFQCGMTVVNAPRGIPRKVSTFVRRDDDCEEDSESPVNWCDEVEYSYVDYTSLIRLIDKQLRCKCNSTFEALASMSDLSCRKMLGDAYPAPTDEEYEGYPELPFGFHYPQSSTDSPKGRATAGVYAIHRGRIYIAPWIQSTEVVVVEWDGIKRSWSDSDLVCDDPEFLRAIKLFVQWEHARDWDKSSVDYQIYEKDYREARADLITTCDDENKEHVRRLSKARMSQATLQDQVEACPTTTTSTTTGGSTTSTTTSGECQAQLVYYTEGTPPNPPNVNCEALAADPTGVLPTMVWNIDTQTWN